MRRTVSGLAVVAALLVAPSARAQSFSLEGFGGYQHLQNAGISDVSNATKGSEGTAVAGGQLLAGLGPLGVGALIEKTVSGTAQPWAGSLLAGFLLPIPYVRLEFLGELGQAATEFKDIFKSAGQTFVGVRPGVSFRIPDTAFILGASGSVRWNTEHGDVGSPTYGIVGRIGIGWF